MSYLDVSYPREKGAFYALLREQLTLYCGGETDRTAVLANASGVLAQAFPQANWAGFYLVKGEELVLGPYQGKPAVSRIAAPPGRRAGPRWWRRSPASPGTSPATAPAARRSSSPCGGRTGASGACWTWTAPCPPRSARPTGRAWSP